MKIAILGFSGCGKSTLARRLGETYKVPVLHLDSVHFSANWVERPLEDKLRENDVDKTVLLTPAAAFQAFLNERFPKPESTGGAGSGTASRGFSEFINSGSAVGAKGLSAVVGEAAKAGGAA
jgi:hypothetical protein